VDADEISQFMMTLQYVVFSKQAKSELVSVGIASAICKLVVVVDVVVKYSEV